MYLNNNEIVKCIKSNMPITLYECGGQWLGSARRWIQRVFLNGDRVTWGSDDSLTDNRLTVKDIEELSAVIAKSTLEEFKANLITEEELSAFKVFINPDNWIGNVFKPNTEKMHFILSYLVKADKIKPHEYPKFIEVWEEHKKSFIEDNNEQSDA